MLKLQPFFNTYLFGLCGTCCDKCVRWQAKAEEEKAAGNRAFGAKEYDKAIGHFTLCIRLDPE